MYVLIKTDGNGNWWQVCFSAFRRQDGKCSEMQIRETCQHENPGIEAASQRSYQLITQRAREYYKRLLVQGYRVPSEAFAEAEAEAGAELIAA